MRWQNIRRAFLALLCGAALLAACEDTRLEALNAAPITRFDVQGTRLIMNRSINARTPAAFEAILAANPQITTLVLQDVPGSLDDDSMIALGYRVRELGLATHLTSTSEVHSGGVDLFLAGVRRSMQPGAELGVHSWSDGVNDAADYPPDSVEHYQNKSYIRAMLGSEEFYWFTIHAAPADGIYLLTPEDIRRFGLLTQ